MAQAHEVQRRLSEIGLQSELVGITTSGDRGAHPSTSSAGLKGLFVAEIVRALQREEVDLAVHSAKDLPAEDPEDVTIAAIPERASPFDVLVSREAQVRAGAVVGSSSLRRVGQLRRARPDLDVVDVRGNVDTRLRKMHEGEVDALVLAAAGLGRLAIWPQYGVPFPLEEMVPAPGQGALAVQTRTDGSAREVVARLDHRPSRLAFEAERQVVRLLGGGCALPLGAYATAEDGEVRLVAVVLRADGSAILRTEVRAGSAPGAAREAVDRLISAGARAILEELR